MISENWSWQKLIQTSSRGWWKGRRGWSSKGFNFKAFFSGNRRDPIISPLSGSQAFPAHLEQSLQKFWKEPGGAEESWWFGDQGRWPPMGCLRNFEDGTITKEIALERLAARDDLENWWQENRAIKMEFVSVLDLIVSVCEFYRCESLRALDRAHSLCRVAMKIQTHWKNDKFMLHKTMRSLLHHVTRPS